MISNGSLIITIVSLSNSFKKLLKTLQITFKSITFGVGHKQKKFLRLSPGFLKHSSKNYHLLVRRMSRLLSFSLIIICIFFIHSCSNNANQVLIKNIDVETNQNSVSLYTVEPDYLFEEFPDHVFGALRPTERDLFENHLTTLLSRQTTASVNGKISHHLVPDETFDVREFELKNGSMKMLAPKPGSQITNGDDNYRFTLIMDQFFFTPYQAEVGGDTYAGHENKTEERLRFETMYLIWDNQVEDAVAWGKIETHTRFNMQDQRSSYVQLISNAFSQIIQVSPFRSRIS